MNPFEVHAQGLVQLQTELAEPIAGKAGGLVKYANAELPAIVSVFQVQQRWTGKGMTPTLTGDVIVQKADCPEAFTFESGHRIVCTAPGGSARVCEIYMVEDKFTFWQITVDDVNTGA